MSETSTTGTGGDNVTLPGIEFLRIDHVGVAVPDLDEALTFYAETFGYTASTTHRAGAPPAPGSTSYTRRTLVEFWLNW